MRPFLALFLHWTRYSGTSITVDSPRAPCSSLAWLFACRCMARCCLRPRGAGFALVFCVLATWPAPSERGSARSQYSSFSGLRVRFRTPSFTSPFSLIYPPASTFRHYTTGRPTRPYPGGPVAFGSFPSQRQTLPGYPHF